MPPKKKRACQAAREGDLTALRDQIPDLSPETLNDRLQAAAGHGHEGAVALPLANKADANARANGKADGRTALHEGCLWGTTPKVVKVLLAARADPSLKAKLKQESLDAQEMAEEKGHLALSLLMEDSDH